ncbi:hypothetical protein [Halegenticoccus tardaugens]|uniref:hypothetical protein n=1 Tax=Halegenticoccus tardaugens TaxID=2071624 RepID=UPI00100A421A|nr:hypothetical protein [Halegenticoccus tardaugens]
MIDSHNAATDGEQGSPRDSEAPAVLENDYQREIVRILKEQGGELHVSELAAELTERDEGDRTRWQRAAARGQSVVPEWVFCLMSLGGLVSVVGSYLELTAFTALSTASWAGLAFGLLAVVRIYSVSQ